MEILTPQYHDTVVNSRLSKLLANVPAEPAISYQQNLKIDSVWSKLPKQSNSLPLPGRHGTAALNWHGWQAFMNTIREKFVSTEVVVDFQIKGFLRKKTDLVNLKTTWLWESYLRLPLQHGQDVIYDLQLLLETTDPLCINLQSGGQPLEGGHGSSDGSVTKYEFAKFGLPFDCKTHCINASIQGERQNLQPIRARFSYRTVEISAKQREIFQSAVAIQIEPRLSIWWHLCLPYHLQERYTCCDQLTLESYDKDWIPKSINCNNRHCGALDIQTDPPTSQIIGKEEEEQDIDSAMLTADELAAVLLLV